MCLAMPVRILQIQGNMGKMELEGNTLDADLSLIESPQVGDWVLVHAGFAIESLDRYEAEENLKMFASMRENIDDAIDA